MSLKIEIEADSVRVWLIGEIDHHAARGLREEIDAAVIKTSPRVLYIDFRDVSFMDSSGIGLVMGRYSLMKSLGGEVRVTNVPSHIRRVMRVSGLDRLAVIENGGRTYENDQ